MSLTILDANDKIELQSQIDKKLNRSGLNPDKYLGTDSEGNVVEKDVLSSSSNVIDVTHYGAKGDGQTDDTNAIAAAMEAVPVGGTLYFPTGTYLVDYVTAKSDMTIRGSGWGSVIKLRPYLTEYAIWKNSCINIVNAERVIVRDIKLDGDRPTQRATAAAQDQRLNGIFITDSEDIYVENVWMYNNGYHGCIMVRARNVAFSHCRATENGYRPIHGHTQIYNCRVSNCLCEDNGKGLLDSDTINLGPGFDGVFFFGVQGLTINDNIVRSNRMCSISVGSDHSSVATGEVIPSRNISITGNVCECYEDLEYVPNDDTNYAKHPSRGISVYGNAGVLRNVAITGNAVRNAHEAFYIYASDNIVTSLNVTVAGNTITDCSIGAKIVQVADIAVTGNQFGDIKKQWIYMQEVHRAMIGNNIVYAPDASEDRLMLTYSCKDITVAGNHINGGTTIAIYSPAANENFVVMGNVLSGFGNSDPIANPSGVTQGNVINGTTTAPDDSGGDDTGDDTGDTGAEQPDSNAEKVYAGLYSNFGFVRNSLTNPYTASDSYFVYTTPMQLTDADTGYELNTYESILNDTDPDDYTGPGGTEPAIVFLAGESLTDAVGIVPLYTVGNGTRTANKDNCIRGETYTTYGFTLYISAERVRELYPTATHVMFQIGKTVDPAVLSQVTFGPLGDGKSYVYRTN